MPVTEVVRIEEIDKHIESVGLKVRDGLLKLIKQGVLVEYPKSLDFQMTVVVEWQSLEVNSTENGVTTEKGVTAENGKTTEVGTITDKGTTIEKQSGFTTEHQDSKGGDTSTSNETRTSKGGNTHTENGDSTTETKQS